MLTAFPQVRTEVQYGEIRVVVNTPLVQEQAVSRKISDLVRELEGASRPFAPVHKKLPARDAHAVNKGDFLFFADA